MSEVSTAIIIELQDLDITSIVLYNILMMKLSSYLVNFLFIILYSYDTFDLIYYGIAPILLADLIIIIYSGVTTKLFINKSFIISLLIETLLDSVFKLVFLISILKNLTISPSLCVAVFQLFFSIFTNKTQSANFGFPMLLIYNIFYYIVLLFVFLKLDQIITWNMYAIIW